MYMIPCYSLHISHPLLPPLPCPYLFLMSVYLLCAKSLQLCLALCNPMDVAYQAPLSVGLSRQEYWRELPCPPAEYLPNPGLELASLDLPDPGIKPTSFTSPALVGRFFISSSM